MTKSEFKKLETILAKVENLQGRTTDAQLKERLNAAKTELLRAWKGE
jgi:hypothetical protein